MKLYIFDLDDTLIREELDEDYPVLMDGTLEVLNFIKEEQSIAAIATHNMDAGDIIKKLNIDHYFTIVDAVYDNSYKRSNVARILLQFPHIEINNISFYDDLIENINGVKALGIRSVHVPWKTGIKLDYLR